MLHKLKHSLNYKPGSPKLLFFVHKFNNHIDNHWFYINHYFFKTTNRRWSSCSTCQYWARRNIADRSDREKPALNPHQLSQSKHMCRSDIYFLNKLFILNSKWLNLKKKELRYSYSGVTHHLPLNWSKSPLPAIYW
jgi:hypothetical protein